MEEQNNKIILGVYVMGIKKRPELANKPCVLQYIENENRLALSITVNESIENIYFDRSKIIGARNVVRTIISQDDFKNKSVSEVDVKLLAVAFTGTAYGPLVGTLIDRSGLLRGSNSGAVTYTSLNEVHITYINDENEQRDLMIQTDLDPSYLIDLINKQ